MKNQNQTVRLVISLGEAKRVVEQLEKQSVVRDGYCGDNYCGVIEFAVNLKHCDNFCQRIYTHRATYCYEPGNPQAF